MFKTKSLVRSALMKAPGIWADRSGDVAAIFGLMAIILFVCMGAAVDYGRWLHARNQTLSAVDAAVLAGGRALQLDATDHEAAIAAAEKFYGENITTRLELLSDTVSFDVGEDGLSLTAEGTAYIATPFLSLVQIPKLPLLALSGADYSKAKLAAGGNSGQDIEVSMMLDVTGSMYGSKLVDLIDASKDLVDIVVWEDQSQYSSKIALVPFAEAVNIAGLPSAIASSAPSSKNFLFKDGEYRTYQRSDNCVSERTNGSAFTDAAPEGSNKMGRVYTSSGGCTPSNPVVPLTNNKTLLKNTIDAFSASGSTAGHLGTAWAWYTLSPNWGSVYSGSSIPQSYSKLSEIGLKGIPKLRKVAVLMTDGEYNVQYCSSGIRDKNSNGSNSVKGNCTAPNQSSATQARTLCTNMKAAGIEVYSVGFGLTSGSEASETLSQCATDAGHVFMADDGEQLKQAFRAIALQISQLYLSK